MTIEDDPVDKVMPPYTSRERQPLPLELEIYSNGWIPGVEPKLPDMQTAQDIADLFRKNYPTLDEDEQKDLVLSKHQEGQQIIDQIGKGNAWLVARTNGQMIGINKFREENRSGDPNTVEILCAWIMVDPESRRSLVAKRMLLEGIKIGQLVKKGRPGKRVSLIADINIKNDASLKLFKKVGFSESARSSHTIVVRKEI